MTMGTTALPDKVAVAKIIITDGENEMSIQHHNDAYCISTARWVLRNPDEMKHILLSLFGAKEEPQPQPEVKPVKKTPKKIVKLEPAKKDSKSPRRTWSDEQKRDIAKRYQSGEGPASIARHYGVTANTIQQICHSLGLKRGERKGKAAEPSIKDVHTVQGINTAPDPKEEAAEQKRKRDALKKYREKHEVPWYLKPETIREK